MPQLFTDMRSERSQQYNYLFKYLFVVRFKRSQLIHAYHKSAYRSIIREILYVPRYFLYQFMQRLQFLFRRLLICYNPIITLIKQIPQLFQKTMYAVYSVRIPRFALFDDRGTFRTTVKYRLRIFLRYRRDLPH